MLCAKIRALIKLANRKQSANYFIVCFKLENNDNSYIFFKETKIDLN